MRGKSLVHRHNLRCRSGRLGQWLCQPMRGESLVHRHNLRCRSGRLGLWLCHTDARQVFDLP